jgi:hypothetical protein
MLSHMNGSCQPDVPFIQSRIAVMTFSRETVRVW